MRKREKVADLIAGQNGSQHRKQLVRSLEDTAARAVVLPSWRPMTIMPVSNGRS